MLENRVLWTRGMQLAESRGGSRPYQMPSKMLEVAVGTRTAVDLDRSVNCDGSRVGAKCPPGKADGPLGHEGPSGGQVHTQTVPMEDVGQSWLADECYATSPDEKEEEKIVLAMGPRPYPNPQKVVPSVEVQGRVSARATI